MLCYSALFDLVEYLLKGTQNSVFVTVICNWLWVWIKFLITGPLLGLDLHYMSCLEGIWMYILSQKKACKTPACKRQGWRRSHQALRWDFVAGQTLQVTGVWQEKTVVQTEQDVKEEQNNTANNTCAGDWPVWWQSCEVEGAVGRCGCDEFDAPKGAAGPHSISLSAFLTHALTQAATIPFSAPFLLCQSYLSRHVPPHFLFSRLPFLSSSSSQALSVSLLWAERHAEQSRNQGCGFRPLWQTLR